MESPKNNKTVIVLLIIIIAILSALCVLFATGTISFKSNDTEVNNSNQSANKNNDSDQNNNNSETKNITAEDIKEIFKVAYNYYELPAVYCGKTESEIVEINGVSRKASEEFTTYDEMLNSLKKYMSIEVITGKSPWSATAKEYYLEKDGKLYCNETYKGYIYQWGDVEIEITNQSTDKVESVATMELIDPENNKTYDKVNITLELKDNNWIITSYKK